jgi:anti-sigma factor RsiW
MNVTRHVISDLWPLYESGEASADTRAFVEAFLAQDPAFATTLRESSGIDLRQAEAPMLPPDHELLSLRETQRHVSGYGSLFVCAMLISFLVFSRAVIAAVYGVLVPGQVLWMAGLAIAFWIAFVTKLWWNRARLLIIAPKTKPAAKA